MKKKFYGIIYLGGNRTCTTGSPNPKTGRMSIACQIVVFDSKSDRDSWVDDGDLSSGERIKATKAICRKHRLGDTLEEFEDYLEYNNC